MADLSFPDILSLAQTIAIIATLVITLYFSRRQMKSMTVDLETRVLNDLDEKIHRMAEIFIQSPQLVSTIYSSESENRLELVTCYYIAFICSHIYHMKQRGILSENEWEGWFQWMKNAFRYGTIRKHWKLGEMESWFDPAFRNFVNEEILASMPDANQSK